MSEQLALFGGPKSVQLDQKNVFTWPIVTEEDEAAVLEVLRRGGMSEMDVTKKLEEDFRKWQGTEYALGFSTGTAAIQAAMWACKVGVGDEIIAPSVTYWATCLQALGLGATIVFAEIDPDTLCLDPKDIEHRITDRTKAIIPVHYLGYPADMDAIMAIAQKHNLKVIEDVSHAQGGLYKGRVVGGIGHVGAMSLMSGKSLAAGEAGMLVTEDREIYDRALAWGHYARFSPEAVETDYLKPLAGLPMGGYKYRMHQLSAAMGRVQLKYYDERCVEIRKAMNYFWDLLEGVPGLKAHRPSKDSGSNMGGWYAAHGLYRPDELEGLSAARFCEAVRAEGSTAGAGCNKPLHLHPLLNDVDIYGHGKPTRIAHSERDVRQAKGSLPVSEKIGGMCYGVPWFKKYYPEIIEEHANAFRKVAENCTALLKDDPGNPADVGGWSFFHREVARRAVEKG